ncbi:hypothetical protein IEU95_09960 [Hoyosella rhizosphaerae]|nr:DNA sulfur modification protein DndB [Hoyosella rhizosphaerae]MBN4927158.1 hypothetical protein [Hoyosella rhizosphaerae]
MTKARLGEESEDPERLLTKSLRPVREVMRARDLDFNQLLQRDLDDHRVATNLIPYLLKHRTTGPAFFPPIVAVLLPFKNKQPSSFPALENSEDADDEQLGLRWRQWKAGDAFQVRRVIDDGGNFHSVNLGQLRWNSTAAQIVVLDGQHRAMALLAIDRTMSRTWDDNEGSKYRSFYERQVEQYLRSYDPEGKLDLSQVEVPVAVCWFPEKTGLNRKPHEAARQLFVDVNSEAKPPSESRIILLSDAELANVLTRSLLSLLRDEKETSFLPLFAVEYDNPDINSSRPARWSVVSNISLLKLVVGRLIFGPAKYLRQVNLRNTSGRDSASARDSFMREQLDILTLFPAIIDDSGFAYKREEIGNESFPLGRVEEIIDRFSQTWGMGILTLFSHVAPYKSHAAALNRLEADWSAAVEPHAALGYDALFGGVGVFWTLKDSYEHYREEIRQDRGRQTTRSKSDDVIKAWNAITIKRDDFEMFRSQEYLASTKPERLKLCKSVYEVVNTHACQLGLALTLGSLWELRKKGGSKPRVEEIPEFASSIVSGINSFLLSDESRGTKKDRRLLFSKEVNDPLNLIINMDAGKAIYFRYFWLEILNTSEGWPSVANWFPSKAGFDEMLSTARNAYLLYLIDEQKKLLKSEFAGKTDSSLVLEARNRSRKRLQRALKKWFNLSEEVFDDWVSDKLSIDDEADSAPDPNEESGLESEPQHDGPDSLEALIAEED